MENNAPTKSADLCYESFESFLENLAPIKLSHGMENSLEAIPRIFLSEENMTNHGRGASTIRGKGIEEASHEVSLKQDLEDSNEIKRLQELVELLQVRLEALQRALEIQEQEVCKEIGHGEDKACMAYERLLTRWRREVCIMLLKQRVDALQVEQRQLQHTQKEQHLTVQLHEARALVEVLKQKERNSQAEIAILTTSTKVAEMTMKAEGARKQHEMEGTLEGVTKARAAAISQILESHLGKISLQYERMSTATCRLDMYGRRIFFAEQQVAMAAGLISSALKPQGILLYPKGGDNEITYTDRPRRRDHRGIPDHAGRANQLEGLLAATKGQLADECIHARELQERLAKSEVEARESIKRATKRVQEQADRDLAAIKRQHGQSVQTLQQKLVKIQAEQARTIVAHHQLERKLSQQQQEFAYTLNQKDIEFKRSLDAKEVEVNNLLDEQNALLVKLKKFWRPILNASSAKILCEKSIKGVLQVQTPQCDHNTNGENSRSQEQEQELAKIIKTPTKNNANVLSKSVQTQTPESLDTKKKRHSKYSSNHKYLFQQQMQQFDSTASVAHPKPFEEVTETGCFYNGVPVTMNKRIRYRHPSTRQKTKDEDLITSYLAKLQKAYMNSSQDFSTPQFMGSRALDTLICKVQDEANPRGTSSSACENQEMPREVLELTAMVRAMPADVAELKAIPNEGSCMRSIATNIECKSPRSSVGSKESSSGVDGGDKPRKNPQLVICIPRGRAPFVRSGSTFHLKARRNKNFSSSNCALRAKLENIEVLSENLLSKGHRVRFLDEN